MNTGSIIAIIVNAILNIPLAMYFIIKKNRQLLTLLVLLSFLQSCKTEKQNDTIYYTITPISFADRTNLKIQVQFQVTDKDSLVISLPSDNYGTPNLHKYVTELTGINGTQVKFSDNELLRIINPNKDGKVFLTYTISYDPIEVNQSSFGPVTHQDYFSFAGCQWLLHIGEDDIEQNFSIKIKNSIADWILHSSIGENPNDLNIRASYNNLISSRIGGGGKDYTFYIKDKPVHIVVKGDFEIPIDSIYISVEEIVKLQRAWFNDYDQPFYLVVINERDDIVAGTAFNNQFVCFVNPAVSQNNLNILLAHEMFHNWLPNKMEILRKEGKKITADDYNTQYEWFSEGFTTYFAKKILKDANLLTPEEFIEIINKELIQIADSPLKNVPYSELNKAYNNRNFTWRHKNLAYWRGALMALKWDAQLQNDGGEKNLSDYIRNLFEYASERNAKLSEQEFFDFSNNYGIDAQAEFEKHILKGETILLDNLPDNLSENFSLVKKDFKNFDPGFDFITTEKNKVVVGLSNTSNAHKAGLRNGMVYNKSRYSTRGYGWSVKRPMKVYVTVDDKEKIIEFIPFDSTIKLQQIIKK